MGLLNIFKRKAAAVPTVPAATETAVEVGQARTRARRRLIGAVVLVAVGVVGFPLVFETQPRPIPVDIPIEIPRKDSAPPLAIPPARVSGASGATAIPEADAAPAADGNADKAGGEPVRDAQPAPAPAKPAADKPLERAVAKPAEKPPEKPADKPTEKPAEATASDTPARTSPADDGTRAAALLEGKEIAKSDASRFIVQIGAYAEASAAQETRQKIERLGLKTYTQVAETPNGNRIRVRMGPFATRDDADKALARAKAAGLSGVILTL